MHFVRWEGSGLTESTSLTQTVIMSENHRLRPIYAFPNTTTIEPTANLHIADVSASPFELLLEITLSGIEGDRYTIETSFDLGQWQALETVTLGTGPHRLQISPDPFVHQQFFRATLR